MLEIWVMRDDDPAMKPVWSTIKKHPIADLVLFSKRAECVICSPRMPPAASGAGSGGANPRLVYSASELGGVGVTLGLGDVLRQNSQDLSPAAQPAIQGGGVPPSF